MASLFERVARRLGYAPIKSKRELAAAEVGRLMADWILQPLTADAQIRRGLRTVRSRSRDLALNNELGRNFLRVMRKNVIGPKGIRLQMRAENDQGRIDQDANKRTERAWKRWGRLGNCTTCGTLTWHDCELLAVEHVARDGEILIRKHAWPNQFGFAIELIEADFLDERLNVERRDGSRIKMGVEFDKQGRRAAYHLHKRHPGDDPPTETITGSHVRVPAEEIIHLYVREFMTQTRGFPWLIACMKRAKMIGGTEEAALVAARAGASKMGFFTEEEAEPYGEDDEALEQDAAGQFVTQADPGTFQRLPKGVDFKEFDPGYPNGDFGPFMNHLTRGFAAGGGVAYSSLTGDLSDVNFSSIRAGLLDERDFARMLQIFFRDHLHDLVARAWLPFALASGQIGLGPRFAPRLLDGMTWRPRGWPWVDPLKDQNANKQALANKTRSRTSMAAETGEDIEEVFEELAEEQRIAERLGLKLEAPKAAPTSGAPPAAEEDDEEGQGEGEGEERD